MFTFLLLAFAASLLPGGSDARCRYLIAGCLDDNHLAGPRLTAAMNWTAEPQQHRDGEAAMCLYVRQNKEGGIQRDCQVAV